MIKALIFLFLAQFLISDALAQEGPQTTGDKKEPVEEKSVEVKSSYNISDAIKKGKQVILEQKKQLEAKEETKEAKEEKLETAKIEARREVYERMIIQEVEASRSTATLESQIHEEQYRRQIMVSAGQETRSSFKKMRFNMMGKEIYDDNVFLTKGSSRKKDYITKISPSVLFSLSSKYISMDSNYAVDIVRYRFQEKQSGVNHLLFTNIRPGIASLPFFKGRGGKMGFEIQNTFEPTITSIASSEETSRTKRTVNNLKITTDYYMSVKKTLTLDYTNNYTHYDVGTDKPNNYTENIISPKFYFHARPKWSLLAGYDYGRKAYPKGLGDSVYHRIKGGATGRFFTKLLANFEVGKEWRNYEEARNGNAQGIFFSGVFLSRFNPSTQASLRYRHAITDSNTTDNPYYVSDTIDFDIERNITLKAKGLLGISYVHNGYARSSTVDGTTKTRQDDVYAASLGLRYYLKKQFYINLEYALAERISNFGGSDYTDNRITGGVNTQF